MLRIALDIYKLLKIIVTDENKQTAERIIDEQIELYKMALGQIPRKEKKDKCNWRKHGTVYECSCGFEFEFTDGDVGSNKFKYCPSCGLEID